MAGFTFLFVLDSSFGYVLLLTLFFFYSVLVSVMYDTFLLLLRLRCLTSCLFLQPGLESLTLWIVR